MIKPTMPNIPGMGAMNDTLEFVKNLWGGMHVPGAGMPTIPGMVMPTLSVDEINKQIADLRAVESWLALNMNMLRATIQALEVQSATITTLQAMGEGFSSAVKSNADAAADAMRAASAPRAAAPGAAAPGAAASSEPAPEAAREPGNGSKRRAAAAEAKEDGARHAAKDQDKADAGPAGVGDFGAPLVNPALWWNMLQDQFKQAVGNAMAPDTEQGGARHDGAGARPAAAGKAAGKSAKRKPNPKSL